MLHEMKTLSRGELPTDSLPCHKRCRLPQDDSLGTFSLSGLGKKAESKTSNSTQTTVCPFFLVARLSISTVLSPVLSEGEESPFADSCSSLSFAQRVGCYPEKVFVLLSKRGKRMERAGAEKPENRIYRSIRSAVVLSLALYALSLIFPAFVLTHAPCLPRFSSIEDGG